MCYRSKICRFQLLMSLVLYYFRTPSVSYFTLPVTLHVHLNLWTLAVDRNVFTKRQVSAQLRDVMVITDKHEITREQRENYTDVTYPPNSVCTEQITLCIYLFRKSFNKYHTHTHAHQFHSFNSTKVILNKFKI